MNGESTVLRLPDGRTTGLATYGDPDGHPVLAFHGTPASRLMYRKGDVAARRFGFRLIAPDRPGYGLTPIDVTPTLASRTEMHVMIADALGLDRFSLLGVSGGAPYATALASRLGQRIATLALVSPMGPVADYVAAGQPKLPLLQRRFFLKLSQRRWLVRPGAALGLAGFKAAPNLFAKTFRATLGAADGRVLADRHVLEGLIEMTQEAVRTGVRGAVTDFAIFGQPWAIDYKSISAPTIVWAGTADRVVPVPVCKFLARQISDARLIILPGAAHFWILEHAAEVLAQMRSMLDNVAPADVVPQSEAQS